MAQTWQAHVRDTYNSVEELESYDENFGIVARCGYDTAKELWNDNPMIGGSTNPSDFGLAKIMIRANSHRAYQKLFSLVGQENAPSYYLPTDKSQAHKGYYLITYNHLEDALKIKGISKCKNQNLNEYGLCWSTK